jgi:hypothetical protein
VDVATRIPESYRYQAADSGQIEEEPLRTNDLDTVLVVATGTMVPADACYDVWFNLDVMRA